MLSNLYQISDFNREAGQVSARIGLNVSHPIFEGHFPGQPVLPGVCQMAIVKDLLEKALQKPLRLKKADQVKFLSMIDPRKTPELNLQIQLSEDAGLYTAQAVLQFEEYTFLKYKARFVDA